ncbi:MAG: hypothetical protein L0J63_01175 [Tetragenococcus koreensis]|nr:hypothetical protein [Tetragenococcus koreensis]
MSEDIYVAVRPFKDGEDDNTTYDHLTTYPREGHNPSPERIEGLLSKENGAKKPVIAKLKRLEPKEVEDKPEEDEQDDLEDKTVDQLKALADEKEIEYNANIKKADLIDLHRK